MDEHISLAREERLKGKIPDLLESIKEGLKKTKLVSEVEYDLDGFSISYRVDWYRVRRSGGNRLVSVGDGRDKCMRLKAGLEGLFSKHYRGDGFEIKFPTRVRIEGRKVYGYARITKAGGIDLDRDFQYVHKMLVDIKDKVEGYGK